jgi:hypothetical protein
MNQKSKMKNVVQIAEGDPLLFLKKVHLMPCANRELRSHENKSKKQAVVPWLYNKKRTGNKEKALKKSNCLYRHFLLSIFQAGPVFQPAILKLGFGTGDTH